MRLVYVWTILQDIDNVALSSSFSSDTGNLNSRVSVTRPEHQGSILSVVYALFSKSSDDGEISQETIENALNVIAEIMLHGVEGEQIVTIIWHQVFRDDNIGLFKHLSNYQKINSTHTIIQRVSCAYKK